MASFDKDLIPDSENPDINKLILCFSGIKQSIKTLSKKIDNMDSKIDKLQNETSNNKERYIKLEAKVENLSNEVDDLKDYYKEIKNETDYDFKTKVGWIIGGITALIAILLEIIRSMK